MKLHVCNATPRNFHMHYRIPENDKVFSWYIDAGHQMKVHHEGPDEVSHIIKQLEAYGAVPVDKIGRNKEFSGIVYSEKPVDLDAIRAGLDAVDQRAIERALISRQNNAIASDEQNARLAQEAGTQVSGLIVETREEVKPGDAHDAVKRHETIEVVRDGAPESKKRGRPARN